MFLGFLPNSLKIQIAIENKNYFLLKKVQSCLEQEKKFYEFWQNISLASMCEVLLICRHRLRVEHVDASLWSWCKTVET